MKKNTRLIPRETWIIGMLTGKYRGNIDKVKEDTFMNQNYYDFEIYEAKITDAKVVDLATINRSNFTSIPKQQLPEIIPVSMRNDMTQYGLVLLEPMLSDVNFVRKLQQLEDDEVFGTIEATFCGFVLDYIEEDYETEIDQQLDKEIFTGKKVCKKNYYQVEKIDVVNNKKSWTEWKYRETDEGLLEGCLTWLVLLLGGLFLLIILITLFPYLLIFIWVYIIYLVFKLIPKSIWEGFLFLIFIAFTALLFLGLVNLFFKDNFSSNSNNTQNKEVPFTENNSNRIIVEDSLKVYFRSWSNYEGKSYEGKYTLSKLDIEESTYYKNNLSLQFGGNRGYDLMLSKLKKQDENNLQGLYTMFDSIREINKLGKVEFCKMLVSFVQDLPYALILEKGCDDVYQNSFIKDYLKQNKGECVGFQMYGINTPLEFLDTNKGDCDTRTLLLYTILSNYKYDVVILSSEFYGHSILGINLPISGVSYDYPKENKKYLVWETTSKEFEVGQLPSNISDMSKWRISLKSINYELY